MPDPVDLNARTEGVFFIPRKRKRPNPPASNGPSSISAPASSSSSLGGIVDDVKDGAKLRRRDYERSWSRCLGRINAALEKLSFRTLDSLTSYIESTRDDVSALSFPTIPTALLTSPSESTSSAIALSLLSNLTASQASTASSRRRTAFIECRTASTLDSLVKATVLGLLDTEAPDHPPTLPHLLPNLPSPSPPLFLTLHQIHLLPSSVLPSFIHVLSRYAATLPFTLLFTTSTASGVFSEVMPSEVLSRLDVKVFECAGGTEVWEVVMKSVFFSLDFEPDVLIDGDTLEELRAGYERIDGSLETLISSLQYIYLKAFTLPLGAFISSSFSSTPLTPALTSQSSTLYKALLSLPSLLQHPNPPPSLVHPEFFTALSSIGPSDRLLAVADISLPRPEDVLAVVDQSRRETCEYARGLRLAYTLLLEIRGFLKERKDGGMMGVTIANGVERATEAGAAITTASRGAGLLGAGERVRAMRDCLMGEIGIGRAAGEIGWRWNVKLVSKLTPIEIVHLKSRLSSLLIDAVPPSDQDQLLRDGLGEEDSLTTPVKLASLLEGFFDRRFIRPKHVIFHEIFFFQSLDDLIKVFRPSPLEALQTALLTPHIYLGCPCCSLSSPSYDPSSLPDTSILFARYLESGKLINLYDWFESFASVVEGRGRPRISHEDGEGERNGKEEGEREEGEEEREKKRKVVQARFMRSFHELDFLGFLKGTKRREDCCLKTFFMLTEEDVDGMI